MRQERGDTGSMGRDSWMELQTSEAIRKITQASVLGVETEKRKYEG